MVEIGIYGTGSEDDAEQRTAEAKRQARVRAERESEDHKDCRCWACLYLDKAAPRPNKGAKI